MSRPKNQLNEDEIDSFLKRNKAEAEALKKLLEKIEQKRSNNKSKKES